MWKTLLRAVLLLIVAGCADREPPLRIGALVWPPYELAYLAEDQGFFDTSRIDLVDYQTPAEVTRAYRYGLVDAFFLTTQFALPGARQLQGSRIAYVIDFSVGGDAVLARPGIDEPADLADKRIGVEASPLGGYMLQRLLDHAGLSREDIELRYVDTPDHVQAYAGGDVDAVITYEPYRSRVLAIGANELFTSRRIPGEIIDVLIVPDSVIDAREADLRNFVQGLEKARVFLAESPELALPVMAEREQMSSALLARALEGMRLISLAENRQLLKGANSPLRALLDKQSAVMRRAGLAPDPVDFESLIDSRLVEEAAP